MTTDRPAQTNYHIVIQQARGVVLGDNTQVDQQFLDHQLDEPVHDSQVLSPEEALSVVMTLFGRPLDSEEQLDVLRFGKAVKFKRHALEKVARRVAHGSAWPPLYNGELSPYVGLRSFQEPDAPLFYGRYDLVQEMLAKVAAAPFLAVLGPSGSGKSSVVRAGLVPRLRRRGIEGNERWLISVTKPGARPLDALAVALTRMQGGEQLGGMLDLRRELSRDESALVLAAELLRGDDPKMRLMLVVDQFEELWTAAPTDEEARRRFVAEEREPFVAQLLTAVQAKDTPVTVVVTMRADFQHRTYEVLTLGRAIDAHLQRVHPMTREELREAIQEPAREAGGDLEPGLADELMDAVEGREGALPLLEYTLAQLWRARNKQDVMMWSEYRSRGGVPGALAARADAILADGYGTAERRDALRQALLRLIQPGAGTLDARRRMALDDLVPVGGSREEMQALLQPLVDERLLTTARDEASGKEMVEITHEALIRAWPTLRGWIDETREDLRFGLQVEEAAKEWSLEGKDDGYLWSGLRLATAEAWIERARPALTERELRFLQASKEAEQTRRDLEDAARQERDRLLIEKAEEAQRRVDIERRMSFRLKAALVVTMVLVVVTAMEFWIARQNANTAEQNAHTAARQAAAGEALFEAAQANGDRSLLLSLDAAYPYVSGTQPMILRAIRHALDGASIRLVLRGHTRGIRASAWSPNGSLVATGGADGTLKIWDSASGSLRLDIPAHAGAIEAIDWSPDGQWVLSSGADGVARIWDASSGELIHDLVGHTNSVWSIAWSPDGTLVLTGGADGTAIIWDGRTGALLERLVDHSSEVSSVSWAPDGKKALTASWDGTARIWDTTTGRVENSLVGHSGRIAVAAWSPDGARVLTGSFDGTVRVWDAETGIVLQVLEDNEGGVLTAAWSPDGTKILTGCAGGTAKLWDQSSGRVEYALLGHSDQILSVGWSPDGKHVVTGGKDTTARVWDARTGIEESVLTGHTNWVWTTVWAPDGKGILTDSEDGTARIWSTNGADQARAFRGQVGDFASVAWSPDGTRVLTGGKDGTGGVWNVETGDKLLQLGGHTLPVDSIAWSPNGKWLLTGSRDGVVQVWDSLTGSLLQRMTVEPFLITSVAWSPDSEMILTGSDDGTARIWDWRVGALVQVIQADTEPVIAVYWSSDGRSVWIASRFGIMRLWDWETGQLLEENQVGEGDLEDVRWSSQASVVLTNGVDGSVQVSAADGTRNMSLFDADLRRIRSADWSPSGEMVLAGGDDGAIEVWDSRTDVMTQVIDGNRASVSSIMWSPEGKRAVIGNSNGTATVLIMNEHLLYARLMERVCSIMQDELIQVQIPEWRGCVVELGTVAGELAEYRRLMGHE